MTHTSDCVNWNIVSTASQQKGERNDCTVKVVAVCANIPYDVAHELMRKRGRRNGKGAYKHQYMSALQHDVGVRLEDVTEKYRRMGVKTVLSAERILPLKGTFLIRVRRHVLAYADRRIQDWSQNTKKRVLEIYEVHQTPRSEAMAAATKKKTTKKTTPAKKATTKKAAPKKAAPSNGTKRHDDQLKVVKALKALKATTKTNAVPTSEVAKKCGFDSYHTRQVVRGKKHGDANGMIAMDLVQYADVEGQAGKCVYLTAKGKSFK